MRPFFRPALLVFIAALAARLTAQPANVQADPTTGALFRPSAATFISGNNLASATGGIVLGANGGTGVANTGKTLTLGGNVTTSGAFGLTLTLTAATGVTLPTTGTLATLAGSETLTNKTLTSPTLTTPALGAATATSLTLSGNISSTAWTTNGVRLKGVAATLTDTTSTGTVAAAYTDVLGGNTIAASNATTFTDYITAFFKEPTAGSLVTMTNKWALGGESLRIGTSTPMSVSTAGAITANSLTGRASTDLTLTGGSTGASLALGQGTTAAGSTLTARGTGGFTFTQSGDNSQVNTTWTSGGAIGPGHDLKRTTATAGNADTIGTLDAYNGATRVGIIRFAGTGATDAGRIDFYTKATGTGIALASTISSTGNLLIGTTTDAASLAGGLVVNGSGAGAAASSTVTGALRVTGGVGVSGAGYFGGTVISTESVSSLGFQHVNAAAARFDARANSNSSAGFTSSTDNGATVWFAGARKDSVGGVIGTDRYNILLGSSNLVSISTAGAVTATYLNSTGGSAFNQFGSGTRTKTTLSAASGEVAFDNGAVDSPGVHFYVGNNANYGVDATASSGLRIIKNMNETGGTVVASFTDTAATIPVPISSTSTGRNTFGGTLAVTGVSAGNATSTGILDFSSGATRIISFGADTGTRGTFSVFGLSSDSSLNTTLLSVSATAATVAGAVVTTSATLSGAGAIPITTSLVKFTSTGASQALTLANGTDGQRLTIVHDVDGGSGILTPTTKTGFSTVTFTNAGDTVSLVYVTTRGWIVTGSYLATIAP